MTEKRKPKKRYPKPSDAKMKTLVIAAQKRRTYTICGGWRSRAGKVCESPPCKNRNRCRMHGGETPRGVANANFKHGRYSKDMPANIAERVARLGAHSIVSLDDNIRLYDARIGEMVSELADNDFDISTVKDLRKLRRIAIAKSTRKEDSTSEIVQILDLIEVVASQVEKWDAIMRMTEQKKKLIDSERRAMHDERQIITIEQMMVQIAVLKNILVRHVDRATLKLINKDIESEVTNGTVGIA